MNKRCSLVLSLLTLAATCVLCLFLYHWDNKYTAPGSQPINGILFLTEEELSAVPVHYLIRGWEFYPGVLLDPEGVSSWEGYRRYLDIGGKGGMVHGCATYRMTLMLPEEKQDYILELPEIFSSYRLYLNGKLLLQLGNPEPGSYCTGIASQMIPFDAGGRAELLLAVSDWSGVYSGLTYPPAFGRTQEVLQAREIRFFLHGAGVLLALLGMALALAFGWRGNLRRGILLLLCCLCFAAMTGYPLFHGLFLTSYQPWYTIEAAGLYGLIFFAVLLSCDLFEIRGMHAVLLTLPCAAGLATAVLRTAGAAAWSSLAGAIFSVFTLCLKWYAAACLFCLSFWSLRKGRRFSLALLCAALSLAACLIFDRLLPLYEPIYGGWFNEVGGMLLTVLLAAVLWQDALDAYRFRLTYEGTLLRMEQHLAVQKEHYHQMTDQIQKARESAHDLRHHMRTLRAMAEQGNLEQILDYLGQYEPHLREQEVTVFSDHPIADAVLCHYAASARKLRAVYDVRFVVPPNLTFPDDELCILLGNLLENAVEAMARQKSGTRRLYLRGDTLDGRLRLLMQNSFDGAVRLHGEYYLSSKRGGAGLGLQSVRTIAEKYGGLADFSSEGTVFSSSVLIPLSVTEKSPVSLE